MPSCLCDLRPELRRLRVHAWKYQLPRCTATVAPSRIPGAGDGLFADRVYRRDEVVAYYSGCYRAGDAVSGDRAIEFKVNQTVDGDGACRTAAQPGDMCNHGGRDANCDYRIDRRTLPNELLVTVVARHRIVPGTELTTNYGPWFQFG